MSWWLLAILYGLAGFGYIIVATYLPLMAKDAGSPLLTAHLWTLVGLSIVPGYLWLALAFSAVRFSVHGINRSDIHLYLRFFSLNA